MSQRVLQSNWFLVEVAEELKMIDGFFTTIFAEDAATLRTWN